MPYIQSSFPAPREGGWTEWVSFLDCPVSCGGADVYDYRTCTNPSPLIAGGCQGLGFRRRRCNDVECPGEIICHHLLSKDHHVYCSIDLWLMKIGKKARKRHREVSWLLFLMWDNFIAKVIFKSDAAAFLPYRAGCLWTLQGHPDFWGRTVSFHKWVYPAMQISNPNEFYSSSFASEQSERAAQIPLVRAHSTARTTCASEIVSLDKD